MGCVEALGEPVLDWCDEISLGHGMSAKETFIKFKGSTVQESAMWPNGTSIKADIAAEWYVIARCA